MHCSKKEIVISKKLKEPSTTIHYNIKKLEQEKAVRAYKAVFDYKKIDEGHCTYIFINLAQEHYADPEKIGKEIARDPRVESVDVCTGAKTTNTKGATGWVQ